VPQHPPQSGTTSAAGLLADQRIARRFVEASLDLVDELRLPIARRVAAGFHVAGDTRAGDLGRTIEVHRDHGEGVLARQRLDAFQVAAAGKRHAIEYGGLTEQAVDLQCQHDAAERRGILGKRIGALREQGLTYCVTTDAAQQQLFGQRIAPRRSLPAPGRPIKATTTGVGSAEPAASTAARAVRADSPSIGVDDSI
jgi:hypothetical protein